jgi:anti-sigma B factor antagonist
MELTVNEKDGIPVISIKGKIMGEPEDEQICETFKNLIKENNIYVVLDLSEVTWMNSNCLGMCLGGLTRLRNRGGDLRIAGLPSIVESLMDRCRILKLFQSYETVDAAVNSF